MHIVGLSGGAGTGKDYLFGEVLQPLGFRRVALADHFKISLVGQGKWTYDDVFVTKNPECRADLQREGTERGRNVYGENIWCHTLAAWMKHWERNWGFDKFAITDIRFPNEADFVKAMGGVVYRIVAPNRYAANGMVEASRQHISETALNDYQGFSGFIQNDFGYEATVADQFLSLLAADRLIAPKTAAKPPFLLGV